MADILSRWAPPSEHCKKCWSLFSWDHTDLTEEYDRLFVTCPACNTAVQIARSDLPPAYAARARKIR